MVSVKIQKLNPEATLPHFSLAGDAAMDLYSIEDITLKPGERASCRTGIAMKIPEGYVALVWDKSGPSHKFGVKTLGGVFDSNYTGEYLVGLVNLGHDEFAVKKGQKIAQVIIQRIEMPEIEEVSELPRTNRGSGAFGSTGLTKN